MLGWHCTFASFLRFRSKSLYLHLYSAILIPAFKHDEWNPFVAKPHQTWICASNYVGPSMQQPRIYATPAPQQLLYDVQPQQQQSAPVGTMMYVSDQGGNIQGHFIPTTAVQPPIPQPASELLRSSSATTLLALRAPEGRRARVRLPRDRSGQSRRLQSLQRLPELSDLSELNPACPCSGADLVSTHSP